MQFAVSMLIQDRKNYTENGIAWITPKDLSVDKSVFISHGENDITDLGLKKSSATLLFMN